MKKLLSVAFLGLCIGLSACNKNESGSEMTRVSVKLTDGPGAYDAYF